MFVVEFRSRELGYGIVKLEKQALNTGYIIFTCPFCYLP